jgi:hypothetical protein
MQSNRPSSDTRQVPPQLVGIIDDARRAGIDTFTLEYTRGLVMASFSAPNHATEIDFEIEAGEDMLRFLRAGAPTRHAKRWPIRCTYDSENYVLLVEQSGKTSKSPLRVKWSLLTDKKGASAI